MNILLTPLQLQALLSYAAEMGAKSVLTGSGYVKPYLKKSRAFRRYGKKNVKTLDRPWADNPHKEKYPFQKLADRPHGNRSRKYFPARHAAPVNLTP